MLPPRDSNSAAGASHFPRTRTPQVRTSSQRRPESPRGVVTPRAPSDRGPGCRRRSPWRARHPPRATRRCGRARPGGRRATPRATADDVAPCGDAIEPASAATSRTGSAITAKDGLAPHSTIRLRPRHDGTGRTAWQRPHKPRVCRRPLGLQRRSRAGLTPGRGQFDRTRPVSATARRSLLYGSLI